MYVCAVSDRDGERERVSEKVKEKRQMELDALECGAAWMGPIR